MHEIFKKKNKNMIWNPIYFRGYVTHICVSKAFGGLLSGLE